MKRAQFVFAVILLFLASCSTRRATSPGASAVVVPAPTPRFEHVVVVVEENQSYDDVIGNNDMPYLNSLASGYGVATDYYANTHPSINNYFILTSGMPGTKLPWIGLMADAYTGDVARQNIASILTSRGMTWKSYAESLPRAGYVGSDTGLYVKRHNPFAYYRSIRRDESQRKNIVPFEQFAKDLKSDTLPNYSFIAPNLYGDAHNDSETRERASCGDHHALRQADDWLKTNISPLVESQTFKKSGLLIVVFDEACDSGRKADSRYDPKERKLKGGGHVPAVIVSSLTPAGTKSKLLYHHESVLRLSLEALGIDKMPGYAGSAPAMNEFFKTK
jgi:phosphatidylinositol-3-phosphatase